jgi:hypothetical protein
MTQSYPFGDLTLPFSELGLVDVAAAEVVRQYIGGDGSYRP